VRSPNDASVVEIGGKNFKQWMDDLKSPDASTREEAIRAVVLFGFDAPKAVPELVKRLQDFDSSPRVRAAIALSMIDVRKEDVPSVVQALGQRLQEDPQAIVRYYAATTLHYFGESARGALPGLVKGVNDRSTWEIRHACIIVLRAATRDTTGSQLTGTQLASVEHALIEALRDTTYQVRLEAIMTMISIGRPNDPILYSAVKKALEDRLVDRDQTVKVWAYAALMAMEDSVDKKHLQATIKFLTHKEAKVRTNAARALGSLGTRAKGAESALVDTLGDKEATVVGAAAWALTQMEGLSGGSRAALLGALKSPDAAVRGAVVQSLGHSGIKARAAVPALVELLQDKDQPPFVLASACWALGEIGDNDAKVETALRTISERKDADESLKREAQTALEQVRKLKR
jgi:HEAT repeat protein